MTQVPVPTATLIFALERKSLSMSSQVMQQRIADSFKTQLNKNPEKGGDGKLEDSAKN